MRLLSLLLFAVPVLAQKGDADAIANRVLQQFDSIAWNSSYKAGTSCREFSASAYGAPYNAEAAWSWHCDAAVGDITTESYYYVFATEPVPLRVEIGLAGAALASSGAVRQLMEAKLTQRFGAPGPEARDIMLRPGGGPNVRVLQWNTPSATLLLFDGTYYLSPLRPREGVRLIALARPLLDAIKEDAKISDPWDSPGTGGPLYDASDANVDGLLRLLRAAQTAQGNRRAGMLVAADAITSALSVSLDDGKQAAEADAARRQLLPLGVHLGPEFKDGLRYDHELLSEVWKKYPDTEWGEYAFLKLQGMGWNPAADGYTRPANPDLFRDVVEHGEAFLAGHPRSSTRLQVLFAVATAYETWWSVSLAPASDENYGAYPRRTENDRNKEAARLKAIAAYEQIQRLAPGSGYALFAARHLPRLRLRLDTGYRRWFEVGD